MKTNTITYAALLYIGVAAASRKGGGSSSSADSAAADSAITAPSADTAKKVEIKPKGPAPAWAPDIKPEMQAVIEKLTSYGDKPIPKLTAVEARKTTLLQMQ